MLHKILHLGSVGVLVAGLTGGTATGLSAQEQANPYTTELDVESGEVVFRRNCSRCHGFDGTGGERGPDLTSGFQRASSDTGLFRVISDGVPNTEMRGIYRTRNDQTVWQLVAYIRSLAGGVRTQVVGNPTLGAQLYQGKGDCASCHVIDGEGGRQGPNLTTIGSRRSPQDLRSDLVDPDERVQPRWWRMRVTHRDGTRVEGLRMGEGTFSVRILDADNNLWSFEKRDLIESERIETSSMPSSAGTLNDAEVEDLVAYLYGLRRGNQ